MAREIAVFGNTTVIWNTDKAKSKEEQAEIKKRISEIGGRAIARKKQLSDGKGDFEKS